MVLLVLILLEPEQWNVFMIIITNSMLVFAGAHSSLQIQTFLTFPHKWKHICYCIYQFNLYFICFIIISPFSRLHLHSSNINPLKSILQMNSHTLFAFGCLNAMLHRGINSKFHFAFTIYILFCNTTKYHSTSQMNILNEPRWETLHLSHDFFILVMELLCSVTPSVGQSAVRAVGSHMSTALPFMSPHLPAERAEWRLPLTLQCTPSDYSSPPRGIFKTAFSQHWRSRILI